MSARAAPPEWYKRKWIFVNRFDPLQADPSDAILSLVHAGEADAGIVYRADAINSGCVRSIDQSSAGT